MVCAIDFTMAVSPPSPSPLKPLSDEEGGNDQNAFTLLVNMFSCLFRSTLPRVYRCQE